MFGRLPWLAFERRRRALRFLVFFDMAEQAIGSGTSPARPTTRVRHPVGIRRRAHVLHRAVRAERPEGRTERAGANVGDRTRLATRQRRSDGNDRRRR